MYLLYCNLSSECHVCLQNLLQLCMHAICIHVNMHIAYVCKCLCICAELTCDLFELLWIVQTLILIKKFDSNILNCSMCVSFVTCTLANTMCVEQCRIYNKLVCKCTLQVIAVRSAYTYKQCQVHNGPIPPHASFLYMSIISAVGTP